MTRLQDEIKQTRPFKSLEEEASLSIARTAALLEHAVGEALKPHGLTPTQYNALRILRGAGAEGLSRNEVGGRMVAIVPWSAKAKLLSEVMVTLAEPHE